ncbi:unnamed protein product [Adineta steineri]|uniref:Uncharacterized protein n=1 Tax=Adineta steineri TaxID=433720 RepID=A0A813UNS9_9BILA|nr:unnamed protein product [Adineta steineri]
MNNTVDISSISAICTICQTSYGLTSADIRAIVVLVILTSIALVICYTGVLWFAIRTRFIPDKKAIIEEDVITNQAFNYDEDIEENVQNIPNIATQPAVLTVENEKERY